MLFFRLKIVPASVKVWRQFLWLTVAMFSNYVVIGAQAEFSYEAITAVLARITINYPDPITLEPRMVTAEIGRFADGAIGPAGGVLINPKPNNSTSGTHYLQGCVPNWASPSPKEEWIALLLRGGCTDAEKVTIAKSQNASAVLFFGSDNETYLQKETKFYGDVVVVYLLRRKGEQLSYLMMNGTKVYLSITRGQEVKFRITSINNAEKNSFLSHNPICSQQRTLTDCAIMTSVLFVSVSFIVLMVVSLAWLIFYYIQRFRYINAKDKLARHLCHVAKKALAKVPVKSIKSGDKEMVDNECCAICIEPYQVSDSLRILPCRHEFHKGCVDPWLLEHRTCPMCKMDILKYYGFLSSTIEGVERGNDHAEESSYGESGNSFASNRYPPNTHFRSIIGTPQVSVISHSEVPTNGESLEETSSNPVDDSPMPLTRQPSSGFGATTTAMIRSMINSARPPRSSRVSPEPSNLPPPSALGIHEQHHNKQDAKSVENCFNSNPDSSADGASTSQEVMSIHGAVSIVDCSCPDSQDCESPTSQNLSPLTSQSLTYARESMSDIEFLVKEIMDLDNEAMSERSVLKSSPPTPLDIENSTKGSKGRQKMELHPVSECPVLPSSSAELPIVDCDHHTILTIESASLEKLDRANNLNIRPDTSQRRLSSLDQEPSSTKDEESHDLEDNDCTVESRRPSSHLVTISHY